MKRDFTEYEISERKTGMVYTRRCIYGKVTGCGNCVGFCRYYGHPGFLTKELRKQHNCLGKKCIYYIPKERSLKANEPIVILFEPLWKSILFWERRKAMLVLDILWLLFILIVYIVDAVKRLRWRKRNMKSYPESLVAAGAIDKKLYFFTKIKSRISARLWAFSAILW